MMRYLNTLGGAIYGFKQSIEDNGLLRNRLDGVPGLYDRLMDWYGASSRPICQGFRRRKRLLNI